MHKPMDQKVEVFICTLLEVTKSFGRGEIRFYDKDEYALLVKLYGSMAHLQTLGNK